MTNTNATAKRAEAYTVDTFKNSVHVHENHKLIVDGEEKFIPAWWFYKNTLIGVDTKVIRETAKAYMVYGIYSYSAYDDHGHNVWVPKSILIDREAKANEEHEANVHKANNDAYTNYLLKLAEENGVKLGRAKSWDKVQGKLASAHVTYKTRKEFGA